MVHQPTYLFLNLLHGSASSISVIYFRGTVVLIKTSSDSHYSYHELDVYQTRVQYPKIIVFLQDVLDSLEFARGTANSTWGTVRAAMGHPEPFPVKYVAIGNEDCGKKYYLGKF
jgi:alpha-L-arabinofuranosidase